MLDNDAQMSCLNNNSNAAKANMSDLELNNENSLQLQHQRHNSQQQYRVFPQHQPSLHTTSSYQNCSKTCGYSLQHAVQQPLSNSISNLHFNNYQNVHESRQLDDGRREHISVGVCSPTIADVNSIPLGSSNWHHRTTDVMINNNPPSSISSSCGQTIMTYPHCEIPYCKEIPVSVKMIDDRDHIAHLTFKLSYGNNMERTTNMMLHIELTNDSDPYFLYYLDVDSNQFHRLKSEQRLLVDLHAFPSKFIELLEKCVSAGNGDSISTQRLCAVFVDESDKQLALTGGAQHLSPPRGLVRAPPHRTTTSATSNTTARLSLVEVNQFKEITHLSLTLFKGHDTCIKQHLAKKLKVTKSELDLYISKSISFESQIRNLEEQSSRREIERQKMVADQQTKLAATRHELEEDKNASEKSLQSKLETWKLKAEAADAKMTELSETVTRLTSTVERLQATISNDQQVLVTTQYNLTMNEAKVKELEPLKAEHELTIHDLRGKLEAAQQKEAETRALLSAKSNAYDEACVDNKAAGEHTEDLEQKLSSCAKEINRGNEIIGKLQTQIHSLKAKIKSKIADAQLHEKNVDNKEATIQSLKKTLSENEIQSNRFKTIETELQTMRKSLETKQAVIESLNNQLTEKELQTLRQCLPTNQKDSLHIADYLRPVDCHSALSNTYSTTVCPANVNGTSVLSRSAPLSKISLLNDETTKELLRSINHPPSSTKPYCDTSDDPQQPLWRPNSTSLHYLSDSLTSAAALRSTALGRPMSTGGIHNTRIDDHDELFNAHCCSSNNITNALQSIASDGLLSKAASTSSLFDEKRRYLLNNASSSGADCTSEYQPHPVPTKHS